MSESYECTASSYGNATSGMRLGRNLLAGLVSAGWTALLGLIVVPVYLHYLGLESYGLVGFFATTQALLQMLDLGIAPSVNREMARSSVSDQLSEAQKLLHTLAVLYWIVGGLLVLAIAALARVIAAHWLDPKGLPEQTVTHAVTLIGLVIGCRWPIGLYQAALNGMQLLTVSSAVNIVMVTLANVGAVVVLAFVSPTIEAFFLWQAGVGLAYALTIRKLAWRAIGRPQPVRFDVQRLKSIWRFSLGMSGIALSGLVFTQLDKLVLSKLLSLADFGAYMLAVLVASGLYVLVAPVFNAVYPRFCALVAVNDVEKLTSLYRTATRLMATALFPLALLLAACSKELTALWTGDREIAGAVAPLVALLAIGCSLHGVMYFPFALQLAYGMPKLALSINVLLMVLLVPLLFFLTRKYAALGGAVAWLTLHVMYVMLGTWLTHRQLLRGTGMKWLFGDVGIPFALAAVATLAGHVLAVNAQVSAPFKVLLAGVLAVIAVMASIALSPNLRTLLLARVNWSRLKLRDVR